MKITVTIIPARQQRTHEIRCKAKQKGGGVLIRISTLFRTFSQNASSNISIATAAIRTKNIFLLESKKDLFVLSRM